MLQPSKFSRSSLDLQNTDLQAILADTALGRLWHSLTQLLRLPNDLVSFLLFLMALSVLCGGLILHIHLSARILQARIDMGGQQAQFEAIEQKNSEIVWHINQTLSLNNLKQQAIALGYVDMPDHQYIDAAQAQMALLPGNPTADRLGVLSTPAGGDVAATASLSLSDTNTQPHFEPSSLSTEALTLNSANSSTASLSSASLKSPATFAGTSGPQQVGLGNLEGGWRQWIQSWLPIP